VVCMRDRKDLSDSHHKDRRNMFQIKASVLPLIYGWCTLGGFLACLFFAYTMHFDNVTANHCKTLEFWPSISATIGDLSPEKNIFRYGMAVGSGSRILSVFINHQLFVEEAGVPSSWKRIKSFNSVATFLDAMRIFTAGMWIYVTSSEDLIVHEVSFVLYVLSSIIFTVVHTILFYQVKINKPRPHPRDVTSFKWKLGLGITHGVLFFSSLHFFFEHLNCKQYAYSKYAIMEWILAVCNVGFDMMMYIDFRAVTFKMHKEKET